jgi:predicted ester cyclase
MPTSSGASTLEANKALLRRYKTGILNDRDVDALGEVAAVGYVDHAALPGQAPGLIGLKQRASILWQALDPHWSIDDVVAENELVALRWHLTGRHIGAFAGLAATGKPCVIRGIDVYRVRNNKMVEHWNVVDMYGFLQQVAAACETGVAL